MRAGKLRHLIVVQDTTDIADGYGGSKKTWVDFKEMRAAIWPQKTKESELDGKLTATSLYTIRTRYYPGFTSSMRIKFGDRVFEILGIKNFEERNRYLDFTCKENA